MVGFILHWASSSFCKLCMSHPFFFCINIAASYGCFVSVRGQRSKCKFPRKSPLKPSDKALLLLKIAHVGFYSARQSAAVKGTGYSVLSANSLPPHASPLGCPLCASSFLPVRGGGGHRSPPFAFHPRPRGDTHRAGFFVRRDSRRMGKNQCHKTVRPFSLMSPTCRIKILQIPPYKSLQSFFFPFPGLFLPYARTSLD